MVQTKSFDGKAMIYVGLSGAVGGMLAILADLIQKENASAVGKLTDAMSGVLHRSVPPLVVMFLLIAMAVALCFIFEARSSKRALYTGASILSLIMTVVPYKTPDSIGAHPIQPPSQGQMENGWWENLFTPGHVFAQGKQPPQTKYPVTVHLSTGDNQQVPAALFSLFDPSTGQVVARSKVAGGDFNFYVSKPYWLRVEVPGYAIAQSKLDGTRPQSLNVSLRPTSIPLSIQRIFRY
jgi:hypothetical protein